MFRAGSPKRTRIWSNSMAIRMFHVGKLTVKQRKKNTTIKTTTKRVGANGKVQFTGSSQLKGSQSNPYRDMLTCRKPKVEATYVYSCAALSPRSCSYCRVCMLNMLIDPCKPSQDLYLSLCPENDPDHAATDGCQHQVPATSFLAKYYMLTVSARD